MLRGSGGPVFSRHHNATTTMAVRSVTRSPGASWERRDETWRRLRVTRLRISYELRDRDRGKGAGCEERTAIHCSLFTIHYSLLPTLKFRQGKFTKNYSLFAIGYSLFTPAYAKAPADRIHYSLPPTLKLRRAGFTIYHWKPTVPSTNRLLPTAHHTRLLPGITFPEMETEVLKIFEI